MFAVSWDTNQLFPVQFFEEIKAIEYAKELRKHIGCNVYVYKLVETHCYTPSTFPMSQDK